jgi:carbamoyltransferase
MSNIVGISAYYHDAACCVLRDGVLVAAAQEERFSRRKHDPAMPKKAFRYCLKESGLSIADIDCIAYYEDPHKKFHRQISQLLPNLTREQAFRAWRNSQRPALEIREVLGYEGRVEVVEHHHAHAASSFYFSGFPDAALLTVDGVGEWATTTYGRARGQEIEVFEEVHFPHSLGLLYSTITSYLGFGVNDGEYKVMGLAPYGKPVHADEVRQLLELQPEGQYRLNLDFFDFRRIDRMYSEVLPELFGEPPRRAESKVAPFHMDMARSLQVVLEEVLLEKARYLHGATGSENLCMAGGVALNCVANSRILREGPFKRLFVQPASGDAGSSLGAAVLAHMRLAGEPPPVRPDKLTHVSLGPSFTADEVANLLGGSAITAQDFRGREADLLAATVDRLAAGKVIGWFQGRMEFGPRALGARSILADPRDPTMRDRINAFVKKREGFRPFAPAVPLRQAAEHFDLQHESPFMLETCQVKSTLDLPAITHVDNSARVQTVDETTTPRFARLLEMFGERTGCPILLNTSFNMRDEPIVCTPVDAIVCFARSEIDTLVLEDFLIDRSEAGGSWEELCRSLAVPGGAPSAIGDRIYTFM